MTWLRVFLSRALDVVLRRRRDDRLAEEVQTHLDLLASEYIAAGMPADAARLAARRAFGGVDRVKAIYRDQRGLPMLDDLTQDVRFAVRLMAKDFRFTLAAVVALALGIGANTTAFTFVNAALLRALWFDEPDQLVWIKTEDARGRQLGISYPDFLDWRAEARTFSGMIASVETAMNVSDEGLPPERYGGSYISTNAFTMLGRAPILGRGFVPGDERPDAPPVAIIAHSVWMGRYSGDPTIIGRTIRVNEAPSVVIGVMPPDFQFPFTGEVWMPISVTANTVNAKRDVRTMTTLAFGRLADSVSLAQAQAELNTIAGRLAQEYPESNKDVTASVTPLQELYIGGLGELLLMVMGAVTIVLLIACVNVANLLLARAAQRAREIALRFSLGATRWRIIRQLMIESLLLAVLGGVMGLGLAVYGVQLFSAAYFQGDQWGPRPYWLQWTMDGRVYWFAAAVCLGTSVLFGLVPALHISRTSANDVLKDGGRSATVGPRARRFTGALMVAQVALTLILLAGAGLMTRSFLAAYNVGQVVAATGVTTMRLALAVRKYPTPERRKQFYRQLDERLAAISAFSAVTVASDIPFLTLTGSVRQLDIEGRQASTTEKPPTVEYLYIGPRYFETLGLRLLRGRTLTEQDGRPGQEGAIVNQRFASMFFPNGDALGQRIRMTNATAPGAPAPWFTIVGVAPTVPQFAAAQELQPVAYVHVDAEPAPHRFASVIVRSQSDTATVVSRLREEIQKVDPDLPGYYIQTLEQVLAGSRWALRIFGSMFALLAGIALVLASVGLYAVTAHGVAERAHEIGVRMALGAEAPQVVWLFVRRTIVQLLAGLAIGLAGALGGGQLLQTFLVRVGPRDPLTLVVVTALLIVVVVAACFLPARRAARLDPVIALRDE